MLCAAGEMHVLQERGLCAAGMCWRSKSCCRKTHHDVEEVLGVKIGARQTAEPKNDNNKTNLRVTLFLLSLVCGHAIYADAHVNYN